MGERGRERMSRISLEWHSHRQENQGGREKIVRKLSKNQESRMR